MKISRGKGARTVRLVGRGIIGRKLREAERGGGGEAGRYRRRCCHLF
jgi:hypothetical protein